jgi:DNA (cytosine-5)-methyltransferase 1
MIKVGSDFSGVGAFNQALIRLGIEYDEVFACDMDKYARQTFIHNYGEPKYYPTNVYEREIPSEPLDIYMTSPPCQAFSLAGKRLGKEDKRGILFFNSHEFIQKNNPRYFIFENVKGLLSDNGGKTFSEWVNLLGGKSINGNPVIFPFEESVPYHIYWKVLNAKHHGVPQNRERVFIIGIRDDEDNTFRWPVEEHLTKRLKDVLQEEVDSKYFLSENTVNKLVEYDKKQKEKGNGFGAKFHDTNGTMSALKVGGGGCDDLVKIGDYRTDEGFRWRADCNSPAIMAMMRDTWKENFTGQNPPIVSMEYKIRRLTPRECFRLMDFPDTFTWPVSDSQAYKQAGNSIVVGVLTKILSILLC